VLYFCHFCERVIDVQIRGGAFSTLPVPVNRRDELTDRRHGDRRQIYAPEAASQTAPQSSGRGEITRIRARASVAVQSADNQLPKFADNLPPRARNAVAAYSNNGPSIAERLGVDLVGVDVYA